MSRKVICFALSLLFFAPCASVEAQQQAKVAKIGWLSVRPRSGETLAGRGEVTRRMLRELGYVEGKNIAFEYRSAENKLDRLPTLADELVHLKVDVLVMSTMSAALAAKNTTKTIPIVFLTTGDPVAAGLVDSLARPGGNMTGFTLIGTELVGKRLELVKETIPKLSRVAVLWNPQNPGNTQQWKESQLAARELRLELHSMEVSSADKFESAFKEAAKARSSALAVAQDSLAQSNLKLIADLAIKNRLPAIYPRGEFVISGGLMSYGADRAETYKRAASMVDKILKGAKPADLPVEQPTKFELVINLKTAKALGLTIPAVVMMRAEKVIK
jgi:putative tryptophan/tyrosine transport system substrate-binding protein